MGSIVRGSVVSGLGKSNTEKVVHLVVIQRATDVGENASKSPADIRIKPIRWVAGDPAPRYTFTVTPIICVLGLRLVFQRRILEDDVKAASDVPSKSKRPTPVPALQPRSGPRSISSS